MWWQLLGGLQAVTAASASEDSAKLVSEGIPDVGPAAEAGIPGFDGKLPTPQQLLEALESMTGLSDDERAQLKEDLLKNIQGRASQAQAALAGGDLTTQTIVLLALLSIVGLVFETMENIFKSLLQSSSGIKTTLQDRLSAIFDNGNVTENFSDLLNRYREMSVEEKQKVEGEVVEAFQHSLKQLMGNVRHNMQPWYLRSHFVFIFALLIVALVLVFFVYKLIKLLSERETKREEKRKSKQLKKKK